MQNRTISERQADVFLLISVAVLMLNFVSQIAAFPFQVMLIVYAVVKSDIKLFPGLFVALHDKACFPDFGAELLKFYVGIAVSSENVFLIAVSITVVFRMFRNQRAAESIWSILLFWLLAIVPALVMSNQARSDGLASWQEPIVCFLTPALYFWGWLVGRTWEESRVYFIKRMSLLFLIVNVLSIGRHYYVFSFVQGPFSVGLAAAAVFGKCSFGCKLLSLGCCVAGLIYAMFGRYISMQEATGYAGTAELGSTFTVVMTIIFSIMISVISCLSARASKTIRFIPVMFIVFLTLVFVYAVGRAESKGGTDVHNDYQNIVERFEYKLIGDRGAVWADGIQDALKPPWFFKRYRDYLITEIKPNGEVVLAMKMPPHNQILTLLVRHGWWLGLFCIIFLFWMHFRMFNRISFMIYDKIMICALLAPSAAVFYAVGLTGQSVWSVAFTSNGLVTLIFPGIVCGAFIDREKHSRGWMQYAYIMDKR